MSAVDILTFCTSKMNTAQQLRLCNRWLGCTLLLVQATGIQLEATSGRYVWSVWFHIITGILLAILSVYHIFLHYRTGNWFSRFARNRNASTRILWWLFLLAAASGIAATVIWADGYMHSHLGAVHGKIGFLMVVMAIIHIAGHIRKKKARRAPGA